jgi:hypothetical protein
MAGLPILVVSNFTLPDHLAQRSSLRRGVSCHVINDAVLARAGMIVEVAVD